MLRIDCWEMRNNCVLQSVRADVGLSESYLDYRRLRSQQTLITTLLTSVNSLLPWSLWRWQRRLVGRGWVMEGEVEAIKKVASSDSWSQFNFSIKTRESGVSESESNWTLVFNVIKLPLPSCLCPKRVSNYELRVNNLVWRIMETSFTRL